MVKKKNNIYVYNSYGTIWEQLWNNIRTVLGQFGDNVGKVLGQFWNKFETGLEQFCDHFGSIFVPRRVRLRIFFDSWGPFGALWPLKSAQSPPRAPYGTPPGRS